MYLKSIEIQGFKSFAQKTVLEFHEGVTGIVGPNGSGKSNIADAVRWVLGEQRVKSLRGAAMQDVIFAGTQLRKPQGYAHVAITLDNSDHVLPVDYTEVTVSRRLYRSGESEYRVACPLGAGSVHLAQIASPTCVERAGSQDVVVCESFLEFKRALSSHPDWFL